MVANRTSYSIVNWRDKGETGEVKESWISQHKYKVFVLGK